MLAGSGLSRAPRPRKGFPDPWCVRLPEAEEAQRVYRRTGDMWSAFEVVERMGGWEFGAVLR